MTHTEIINKLEQLVADLSAELDHPMTVGYIGNVESWGDDRSWFVGFPHPDRIGRHTDRFGGNSTDDLIALLSNAEQRLKAAAIKHKAEYSPF